MSPPSAEQPRTGFTHPDQTGTWEPDYQKLANVVAPRFVRFSSVVAPAIVAEYRRQQADRGIVEVRREDVQGALAALRAAPELAEEALEHFDANALAAATEQKS